MDTTNTTIVDTTDVSVEKIVRKPRGFAAMSREQQRALASQGGKAAWKAGTAHRFTTEEARKAGAIGGKAFHKSRGRSIPKEKNEGLIANDVKVA